MADNFNFITPEWTQNQLRNLGRTHLDLAKALNSDRWQISNWLRGNMDLPRQTKEHIYHFFSSVDLTTANIQNETLNLPSMQYLPVKTPSGNPYVIRWNHLEPTLTVNRCDRDECSCVDLNKYKYLLINPDYKLYSILYKFDFTDGLTLIRKMKSPLAFDFEIKYGNTPRNL